MIRVVIDKSQIVEEGKKAAFGIVKSAIERSLKKFEREIAKEGGSVTVTVTGPGTFEISMDKLSLKLRRKISSAAKKLFA